MSPEILENVRARALFVSDVQFCDELTPERVRAAVMGSVRRHGPRGCAALVAREFGEHPETAAPRMSWVLGALRSLYPGPSVRGPSPTRPHPTRPSPSPLAA